MTPALKLPSLDDLLSERDRILAEHAQELADIDNQIASAMRARGLAYNPPSSGTGKSAAKRSFHERNRQECIKKGWVKADGSPDLERLRLERKAASLKISVATVIKQESDAKAKRAVDRLKGRR
jgi:hypothetical protein